MKNNNIPKMEQKENEILTKQQWYMKLEKVGKCKKYINILRVGK